MSGRSGGGGGDGSSNFLIEQLLSRAEHTMSSITSNDFHRLHAEIQHEDDTRKDIILQLQTSSRPIHFNNIEKFLLFCKVFAHLADSCRYDIHALRTLYRLSHDFQVDIIKSCDIYMHCKQHLHGLHIWNNIPFWLDAVYDLCRIDIAMVEKIFAVFREHDVAFEEYFFGLSKSQVIATMMITRIQAVAASMKSLGLSKDTIESFFHAVNNKYRLEDYGFEVKDHSLSNIAEVILNAALDVMTKKTDDIGQNFLEWLQSLQQHLFDLDLPSKNSNNNKKKFQLKKYGFSEVLHVHDIGYSVLSQLLFIPALNKVHEMTVNPAANMNTFRRVPSRNMMKCCCGREIATWKLIGRQQIDEIDIVSQAFSHITSTNYYQQHYDRLTTLSKHMCELCYRLVYQDPMTASYDQTMPIALCPIYGSNDSQLASSSGSGKNVTSEQFLHGRFDEYEKTLSKLYYDIDIQPSSIPTRPSSISTITTLNTYGTVQSSNTAGTSQLSPQPVRNNGSNRSSFNMNVQTSHHYSAGNIGIAGNITPTGAYANSSNAHLHNNRPLPPSPSQHPTNSVYRSNDDLKRDFPTLMSKQPSQHSVHHDDDDNSVVSGMSKLMVDDDGSVARRTHQADIPPLSRSEFNDFFIQLWRGITITLVYSSNPLVEKTRLIFIRSHTQENNEHIQRQIRNVKNVAEWLQQHASSSSMIPLYLGWAHRSEANALEWNSKKSVLAQNIKNIKVGSKKYKNCLKITTEAKTIVLKLEEDDKFQFLLRGLTQFISLVSSCYRG